MNARVSDRSRFLAPRLSRPAALWLVLVCLAVALPPPALAVTAKTPGVFAVSPTGEGTYTMPITLPPGTSGMTPSLAFVYGSQRGNGLLGMGLRVTGFSAITRCAKTIAQDGDVSPVLNTTADKLCLDGNKLRLTGGTYGSTGSTYQTELETFAKVTLTGSTGTGTSSFEVRQKNGLIYEYGNTTDSRIEVRGSANVVRLWALSKIRDRDGNYIEFAYTEDNANGTYRPNEVRWTGNTGQGLTPAYKAVFVYEARSSTDPLVRYENGYKSKETNRLLRLDVFYNTTNIVRRYTASFTGAGSTARTRTQTVQECGKGDLLCSQLVWFNWNTGTNTLGGEGASGASLSVGTVAHSIDANGDGRMDLVYPSGGNWYAMFGQAGGGYGSATSTGIAATNPATSHSIDYNGDGIRDVLFSDGTNWRVLQGSGTGTFTQVTTSRPATGAANGQIKVADINGDGLEDLVYVSSGTTLRARLNSTSGFSASDLLVYTLPAGNSFDTNPFGVPGVEEYRSMGAGLDVDFNGDGRTDFLAKTIPTGGGATTWRTLVSTGTVSAPALTADSTISSAAAERPLILDLNGDGYSDVIGRNGGNWIVTFARGGRGGTGANSAFDATTVSPSITTDLNNAVAIDYDTDGHQDVLLNISGTWNVAYSTRESVAAPASTGYTARSDVRAVDVDGDGLYDLAFNNAGTWTSRMHDGGYPDLAQEGYDAFGIYFATFYKGLHELSRYTRDANPTFPAKRFTAPLQVVDFYVYADGTGYNSYVDQTYWNANWHAQGRGFLGFTKAKDWHGNTDLSNFVEYSQTFPHIGLPTSTSIRRGDHTTKVAESVLTLTSLSAGSGFETRSFPYASQVVAKRWESDGAYHHQQITQATTTVTMDTYGTPYDVTTTTVEQASGNGAQSGASYVSRTYTPTGNLVNDTTNWCLGQRGQVQSIKSHSAYGGSSITRTVNQTWDAPKCRITQTVAEPGNSTRQVTTVIGYDGFGNVNSRAVTGKTDAGAAMATRTTTTSWGTTGQFPISVTNPLSQTTSFGYDLADGTRTSATDPNGIQFTMQYDARGRLTRTNNPDGTAKTRSYNECTIFGCENGTGPNELILIDKTLDTSGNTLTEQWTYVDEFERPLVASRQTMNWGWNRVNYEYDKQKNLKRQTAPFWWGGGTAYWTNFTYDRLNRLTQVSRPISDSDPTLQYQNTYYEGLTTRAVDANGKERKTIRNVAGGVAQTRDHDSYGQNFDYDAFGNAVRVMDTGGVTLQTGTFDVVGMRTASTDADRGSWTYAFNSLGEMVSQTDANTKTTTWTYDALGRMTQRLEPIDTGTATATWTWGTAADNSASNKYIGRLKSHSISGTVYLTTYTETNTYDQYGRLIQTKYTDGSGPTDYYVDREYQSWTGYLNSLTYPESGSGYRLRLQYEYQVGELKRIKDYNASWYTFWEANTNNARGQNIEEQNGNGIKTVMGFDEVTGRMDYIQSGLWGGTGLQNLSYAWDKTGNLTQRQDNNQGLTENFYYDNLYRLDYSQLNGSTNLDLSYAANGNITWKSDAGSYYYAPSRPHAVDSVTGGPIGNKYYAYDSNGNQTWNAGQGISYYTNGLVKYVWQDGGTNSFFQYGADGQRWKHDYNWQWTTYNHTYVDRFFEKVYDSGNGKTTYKHYLFANGMMFGLKLRDSWGGDTTNYLHADHLGSTANITDGSGSSMVGASYDAFGDRRGTGWTGDPASWELSTLNSMTRRGFTEHEMMDSTALVHMNGRVFNPVTGRFVSADPFIDGVTNTQGWNRYGYVSNRALSSIDPLGFDACDDVSGEWRIELCLGYINNLVSNPGVTWDASLGGFTSIDYVDVFSGSSTFNFSMDSLLGNLGSALTRTADLQFEATQELTTMIDVEVASDVFCHTSDETPIESILSGVGTASDVADVARGVGAVVTGAGSLTSSGRPAVPSIANALGGPGAASYLQHELSNVGRAAGVVGPVLTGLQMFQDGIQGELANMLYTGLDFGVYMAVGAAAAASPFTAGASGAAAISAGSAYYLGGGARGVARAICSQN